jgi:hypothetical protein
MLAVQLQKPRNKPKNCFSKAYFTAFLHNAIGSCTMPCIPAQCLHNETATLHNTLQLAKNSVQPKQLQKQPETKTLVIVIQQNAPRKPKFCSPEASTNNSAQICTILNKP